MVVVVVVGRGGSQWVVIKRLVWWKDNRITGLQQVGFYDYLRFVNQYMDMMNTNKREARLIDCPNINIRIDTARKAERVPCSSCCSSCECIQYISAPKFPLGIHTSFPAVLQNCIRLTSTEGMKVVGSVGAPVAVAVARLPTVGMQCALILLRFQRRFGQTIA